MSGIRKTRTVDTAALARLLNELRWLGRPESPHVGSGYGATVTAAGEAAG